MDDTRTIKFQVKGQAYTFAPLTEDQRTALVALSRSARGGQKMFRILELSMGEEQYDKITDRLIDPDDSLSTSDFSKALERLIKESAKEFSGDDDD